MLLTGTHPRTLDDKNRMTLPSRIREQLGEVKQLFVTQGMDQCLWIYDPVQLERLSEKIDKVPATDAEARVFRRLFYAQMEATDVDKNGRILLPQRLVHYAGLGHDVTLIGVRDHMELWDAARWQAYMDDNGSRFDAVAENSFRRQEEA